MRFVITLPILILLGVVLAVLTLAMTGAFIVATTWGADKRWWHALANDVGQTGGWLVRVIAGR